MFVIGVVWFAVASLLCGLAPNLELLVAGRALQGVGGALLTPGSLALISASFRGPDRAAAIGAWSGLGGIAGAVGPFLGGWLVEWTWRAVFLINLPLAALVVVVALRHVPETRDPEAAPGLDVPGTVLAAAALAALTWSLTVLGAGGAAAVPLAVLAAGLVALAAFVAVERRSPHPLVPPQLFADRAVHRGQRGDAAGLRGARRGVPAAGAAAAGRRRVQPAGGRRGAAAGHGDHARCSRRGPGRWPSGSGRGCR